MSTYAFHAQLPLHGNSSQEFGSELNIMAPKILWHHNEHISLAINIVHNDHKIMKHLTVCKVKIKSMVK